MPKSHEGIKMYCEKCGAKTGDDARFYGQCGTPTGTPAVPVEPDWDSLQYDDETPVTEAEADELYGIATEEEIEDEFDLPNSGDEGSGYYRRVLAIVRWRRANGK